MADSGGEHITAMDVILDFDRTKLDVASVANATGMPFWWGRLGEGRIMITAYYLDPFSYKEGRFTIAHVTFRVLSSGSSPVNLNFTPGSTTDSNLWSINQYDALGGVTNASYTLIQ
jgi:hypothetical protein